MDLKFRAIEGAFWSVLFAVANKVVTFAGQFALAWLLTPKDMGLANMAQAMAAFTAVLSGSGLGNVLVQRRNFEKEAGQAFWIAMVSAILSSVAVSGMALASSLIGKPEVKNLLGLLAVVIFIAAPVPIFGAGLQSKLNYKGFAFSQFTGGIFYTLVAVLLAWLGWGPYSLIVPMVPRYLVSMIAAWKQGGGFSVPSPDWKKISKLIRPICLLSFSNFFMSLFMQGPIFICGMVLGPEKTGLFSWSWLVASQVVFLLASNLGDILLPTFTQIKSNDERMIQAALKAARVITVVLLIACGAQALFVEVLIKNLLPIKWHPAVPSVVIFSLGLIGEGFWISGTAWLNAQGKYKQLVLNNIFLTFLNVTLTWLGAVWFDFLGAVVGCAGAYVIAGFWFRRLLRKSKVEKPLFSRTAALAGTIFLWVICFSISWGRNYAVHLFSGFLFILINAWIWWYLDKREIKEAIRRLY